MVAAALITVLEWLAVVMIVLRIGAHMLASPPASRTSLYVRGVYFALARTLWPFGRTAPIGLSVSQRHRHSDEEDERFAQLCHCQQSELLYISRLVRLTIEIVTHPSFHLNPLGLIHTRERFVCRRRPRDGEVLDMRCRFDKEVRVERGLELTVNQAVVDADGETIIEAELVFLKLMSSGGKKAAKRRDAADDASPPTAALVTLPRSLGVDFARLTGDWNPHHIWPLAARVLGFRGAIVQGTWTLYRAVGQFERDATERVAELECQFKTPLYLGATARFAVDERASTFGATNERSGAPHIVGSVVFASAH